MLLGRKNGFMWRQQQQQTYTHAPITNTPPAHHTHPPTHVTVLQVVINGPSFFLRFADFSRKRERNAAVPIIMFHEVATLVHLIENNTGARGGYPFDHTA